MIFLWGIIIIVIVIVVDVTRGCIWFPVYLRKAHSFGSSRRRDRPPVDIVMHEDHALHLWSTASDFHLTILSSNYHHDVDTRFLISVILSIIFYVKCNNSRTRYLCWDVSNFVNLYLHRFIRNISFDGLDRKRCNCEKNLHSSCSWFVYVWYLESVDYFRN